MNDETNRKIRVSLTRFVYTDLWAPKSSSLVIRMSSSLYREGTCHMGVLFPAFKKKKESQSVFVPAVSQVLLIQSIQYAKVTYLEVAYSAYGS